MDWLIETSDVRNSDGFTRAVTLARPAQNSSTKAIFCTDGQVVPILSKFLDLGVEQEIPTLIGVHSRDDLRAQEYLHDDSGTYQQHRNFFTTSVWSWAEDQLETKILPQDAAIFGFSNGGVFALHTGMTLRESYSAVIALSLPPAGRLLPQGPGRLPPIYLACGNQGPEMKIRKNMIRLARTLNRQGANVCLQARDASHELRFWARELCIAIDWWNTSVDQVDEDSY